MLDVDHANIMAPVVCAHLTWCRLWASVHEIGLLLMHFRDTRQLNRA